MFYNPDPREYAELIMSGTLSRAEMDTVLMKLSNDSSVATYELNQILDAVEKSFPGEFRIEKYKRQNNGFSDYYRYDDLASSSTGQIPARYKELLKWQINKTVPYTYTDRPSEDNPSRSNAHILVAIAIIAIIKLLSSR